MSVRITHFETHGAYGTEDREYIPAHRNRGPDVRFPTGLSGDGTDAMYVRVCGGSSTTSTFTLAGTQTVTTHLPTLPFTPPLISSVMA
jgi:hypothetical protein